MYSFETTDVKFELLFGECFDYNPKADNPYNTVIFINVYSHDFSGKSEWAISFKEFQRFAYELNKLYTNLKGKLQLADNEYGSQLNIKCDNTGKFNFTGKLVNYAFQKLEFNFTIDQTFLKDFIRRIFNDYGKLFKQ